MYIYDEWQQINANPIMSQPLISDLGAGSDHAAFIYMAGVSSVSLSYSYDLKLGLSSSPCYHCAYETFYYFDNFIDPEYKYSRAMAQVVEEMVHHFADTPLLDIMNVTLYHEALEAYTQELETSKAQLLAQYGLYLDDLRAAVNMFGEQAREFEHRLSTVELDNELEIPATNDQLMQVERAFIDPQGVPLQNLYKHLFSAPSKFNSYTGSAFPGLQNLLFDVDTAPNRAERC